MPSWIKEHGADYRVPHEILSLCVLGFAEDLSWHNDTCPCFGILNAQGDATEVCIWVEHPYVERRDDPSSRFCVVRYAGEHRHPAESHCTNDLKDCLRVYMEWRMKYGPKFRL